MGTGLLMIVLALAIGFALGAAIFWLRLRENGRRLVRAEARARVLRRELAITRYDASQARTLLAALLDAYSQPVMITTSERVILLANTAALALIGLPREQVIGRVVASVLQDYDTTRLLQGAAQSGQPGDHTFQRAITGQTWRATVTPLRLGLPAMLVVGHAADDSATPETPEQSATIPVSAETSAEPVSHLILTIEDLTALKRLEITRRDFVAHVSHELRTPLAAVKLLAETLLNALDRDPDAAREFGQRIMDEVDHLTQMVNELLELSRIESGALQLHPEPTDIDSLIEVVVERMTPLANACGVRLSAETLDTLPDALVDGERIAEALINLIDNGLKYTPSGGQVTISAQVGVAPFSPSSSPAATGQSPEGYVRTSPGASGSQKDQCPMLIIQVRDTGVGISEDDLPRIFERFFKVDRARTRVASLPVSHATAGQNDGIDRRIDGHTDRRAAGTGLGLAIARHLIELHGGRIWAESRVGHGSVFSFTVPLAKSANGHAAES